LAEESRLGNITDPENPTSTEPYDFDALVFAVGLFRAIYVQQEQNRQEQQQKRWILVAAATGAGWVFLTLVLFTGWLPFNPKGNIEASLLIATSLILVILEYAEQIIQRVRRVVGGAYRPSKRSP